MCSKAAGSPQSAPDSKFSVKSDRSVIFGWPWGRLAETMILGLALFRSGGSEGPRS
ncbi:MAG: hypothetical protein ACI8TX_001142, partial [Hyphomicrobiaceae bacterium]